MSQHPPLQADPSRTAATPEPLLTELSSSITPQGRSRLPCVQTGTSQRLLYLLPASLRAAAHNVQPSEQSPWAHAAQWTKISLFTCCWESRDQQCPVQCSRPGPGSPQPDASRNVRDTAQVKSTSFCFIKKTKSDISGQGVQKNPIRHHRGTSFRDNPVESLPLSEVLGAVGVFLQA